MKELDIGKFFKKIVFTDNKSVEIFKEITGNSKDIVIIGDSIRNEISIGNKLNYTTVWVRQGKFKNLTPKNNKQKPTHTIDDIKKLKELIATYE